MLDVIKANEEMVGKINPRYDLKMSQMNDLLETYENPVNLMIAAFRFGYLQGSKEKEAMMKTEPEQIKNINDCKQSIMSTMYKIKHKLALETIDRMVKLIKRYYDNKEYITMSSREKEMVLIINDIFALEKEEHVTRVSNLIKFLRSKEDAA